MGKKGGVFKEIEVGFSDLNKRIEIAKKKNDESKLALCDKQLKALNQVAEYVFSYSWVKKDKVKLILEDIHLNNYDYSWVAEKYGMNREVVYPHSFRHRFAKNFLDRFNDLALLADLMGHESIETTRIYLRRTASEQQKIVDKVVNW